MEIEDHYYAEGYGLYLYCKNNKTIYTNGR